MYFVDSLDQSYQSAITKGVVQAVRQHKADLMVIVGGPMLVTNRHLKRRKFIYDLPTLDDYDGVVLLSASLASHRGQSELISLILKLESLPLVSIGLELGRGDTVLVDNAGGMRKLSAHLFDGHNYRRVAFIAGPSANPDSNERLATFREELTKRGLDFPDEHLVKAGFTEQSGVNAIVELMDDRGIDVRSLDVIVSANDVMAVGAMDELTRRGIRVPDDVAIVGFDDVDAARYAHTPLTTLRQPLVQQGERAIQKVLATDGSSLDTVMVSPKLIIRRSCGCGRTFRVTVGESAPAPPDAEGVAEAVTRERIEIEREILRIAEQGGNVGGWEEILVSSFIDCCAGTGCEAFLELFETLVKTSIRDGESLRTWASVLDVFDQYLVSLTATSDAEEHEAIDAVLKEARSAMLEIAENMFATHTRQLMQRTVTFGATASALLTTLDEQSLVAEATRHLPTLGIDTCSISIFDPLQHRSPSLRRLLVLEDGKRKEVDGLFPSGMLAAPEIVNSKPHALVVEPLCFHEDTYGVAAFEYGPTDGDIYEQLGAIFSASVKAILMTQENAKARSLLDSVNIFDPLTGLHNSRYLKTRLQEELARTKRTRHPLSLVLMSIDGLRRLNQELGVPLENQALTEVAATLKRVTEPMEIVARVGEVTFAVILPDTSSDEAITLAGRFRNALIHAHSQKYHALMQTSFGIETVNAPHDTNEQRLMDAARRALKASVDAGGDCITHAGRMV